MTVMCDRFFGLPQSLIRNGLFKNLSKPASDLIVGLWHESERYSTRKFTRTTREMIELIGGSRNSHAKARAELIRAGLVVVEPKGIDGFEYHLCNPETGEPWPLPPKVPVPYRRKNSTRSTASSETDANCQRAEAHMPLPAPSNGRAYLRKGGRKPVDGKEVNKPANPASTPDPEGPDTSFPFGHNAAEETDSVPQRQDRNRGLSWDEIEHRDQDLWTKN